MITLTREILLSLRTPAGGFNKATADALGAMWPLQAGWLHRLVDTEISQRRFDQARKAAAEGPRYRRNGNASRSRRR